MSKAYGLPGLESAGWPARIGRRWSVRALQAFPLDLQLRTVRGAGTNRAQSARQDPGKKSGNRARQSCGPECVLRRLCASLRLARARRRLRRLHPLQRGGGRRGVHAPAGRGGRSRFSCRRVSTDRNSVRCRRIACGSGLGAHICRWGSRCCANGSSSTNQRSRRFCKHIQENDDEWSHISGLRVGVDGDGGVHAVAGGAACRLPPTRRPTGTRRNPTAANSNLSRPNRSRAPARSPSAARRLPIRPLPVP